MKKILVTYFEPFGGETENVSALVGGLLPNRIADMEIEKLLLPVEFGRAAQMAVDKAESIDAKTVISLGQAGGRKAVTPEMAALNLRFASIPDNAGNMPQDEPCIAGAQNAYFSTLPVREMAKILSAHAVACTVSYSAGTYVCNDLYFRLLCHFDGTDVRTAFIHLPKENENMRATDMAKALEFMIMELLAN